MAIGDTDLPEIRFSDSQPHTIEANGWISFNVELSEPVTAPVTFWYRTVDGTADVDSDYYSRWEKATFAVGATSLPLQVYVRADAVGEADQFYFIELFNPAGATFGGRNHSLRSAHWILDEDAGGGQPAVAVAAPVVLEGNGTATFTISLSEQSTGPTEITYTTVADSAAAGSDFVAKADSVTIADGETEARVSIALTNGSASEAAEAFGLKVETDDGRAGFGLARILDDDGSDPVISIEGVKHVEASGYQDVTLRLSEAADQDITVSYRTVAGTADAGGVDFNNSEDTVTFAAGTDTARIRIYPVGDAIGERDESWLLELFNPVGAGFGGRNHSLRSLNWILDEDAGVNDKRAIDVTAPVAVEGRGEAVFTLSLSEALATDTTVRYATVAGSAAGTADFKGERGTVTFHAGQTEASVGIALVNDRLVEAAETFGLKVTGTGVLAGFGTATVLDDDGKVPVVSIEGIERVEASGWQKVVLRLSEASSSEVKVDLRTFGGTAQEGNDYNALDTQVTFAPRQTAALAQVYLLEDSSINEADEHFYLGLANPDGARFGPGDQAPRGLVWIRDDEDPGPEKRTLLVEDVSVTENAGRASFTIGISRPLEDDLVIRYRTWNGTAKADSDFVGEKGAITLHAGATEAVVSVRIKDDGRHENAETFKVQVLSFDRDEFAPSGHDLLATARIVDNDPARALEADFLL